jgi:hypothetical protein
MTEPRMGRRLDFVASVLLALRPCDDRLPAPEPDEQTSVAPPGPPPNEQVVRLGDEMLNA